MARAADVTAAMHRDAGYRIVAHAADAIEVVEAEWPVVARADGDSGPGDYARHQQALAGGEYDEYRIRVRQHADGCTLVYAVLLAAYTGWQQPAGGESWHGGILLPDDHGPLDVETAIWRVGRECRIPDRVIRTCIASLPTEVL